ncbi:hypothetical protein J6590_010129 [Homalodisca vitripennis]|nr:hypothetical protein J6590_010129 [Homalodisca vitripennis]
MNNYKGSCPLLIECTSLCTLDMAYITRVYVFVLPVPTEQKLSEDQLARGIVDAPPKCRHFLLILWLLEP